MTLPLTLVPFYNTEFYFFIVYIEVTCAHRLYTFNTNLRPEGKTIRNWTSLYDSADDIRGLGTS